MAILHLNWVPRLAGWEGLLRKLAEQAEVAAKASLPIEFCVLTRDPGSLQEPLMMRRIVHPAGPRRVSETLFRMACIQRSIAGGSWDAVVLRYPGASDLTPLSTIARLHDRLITEHHTDMLAELAGLVRGPLSLAKLWAERLRGPAVLARSRGVIGVTEEIRRSVIKRIPGAPPPSRVIGNGYHVTAAELLPCPAWQGGALHLLFAAATFSRWHGLDRLLAGLAGSREVVVHLVGRVPAGLAGSALPAQVAAGSVVCHGPLDSAGLRDLASRCHAAVSSLALHRLGLVEACPLKTREYLAWGMPVILAYRDIDLPDPCPGILRLPADESPVQLESVRGFVAGMQTHLDQTRRHLHATALERMDWLPKLSQLVAFVSRIATP